MSGHNSNLDAIKTHFISGEPGTTGREPFEDAKVSGQHADHSTHGPNVTGTEHQRNAREHGVNVPVIGEHSHSSSGQHGLGSSGQQGLGSSGQHGLGSTGSTGLGSSGSTGLGSSGHSHGVDSLTAGSGTHAAATSGHGLGHGHDSNQAKNPLTTDYGVGHSHDKQNDNRGIIEKAKDVLGGNNTKNHTDIQSSSHNNHNSSATTGAGIGAGAGAGAVGSEHAKSHFSNDKPTRHTNENEIYPESDRVHTHNTTAGADLPNRDVVDKINDALPGTNKRHEGSGLTGAQSGVRSNVDQRDHGDRVGALGQDSSKYAGGDLHSGPRTGGAAGTDRFDSSATHSHQRGENHIDHDTSQRAPGQSTGGVGGILGTSDKDFTGRERQGKGAYADTDGPFELNQSGPAGNTALTGREGNLDNNPVANRSSHPVSGDHAGTAAGTDRAGETGEKKGLLQKVKEALH